MYVVVVGRGWCVAPEEMFVALEPPRSFVRDVEVITLAYFGLRENELNNRCAHRVMV